jgi:hypothetical protein
MSDMSREQREILEAVYRQLASAQDEARRLKEALDGCFMLVSDALLSRETIVQAIIAIHKKQAITPLRRRAHETTASTQNDR